MVQKRMSILIGLLSIAIVAIGLIQAGVVRRETSNALVADHEATARAALEQAELRVQLARAKQSLAAWAYGSNLTEYNLIKKTQASAEFAELAKTVAEELKQIDFQALRNDDLKRRFTKLTRLDYAALPEEKFKELLQAVASMESNYAKIKICSYKDKTNCHFALDPEITEILGTSNDPKELEYYWTQWHEKAGKPAKEAFQKYVDLNKESAILNGFNNGAEVWLNEYDDPSFEQQVEDVIVQIRPLYEQIHAYVRFKLRQKYGPAIVSENGPIPIHLLGNMWGQTWEGIADITTPFPEKKLIDVTDEMIKQGYNPLKMFKMGDDFFQSLNMTKLPQ
ncbi:angiotensin-converting enzyme-like [Uranotaenia lowii]|uniref:angiotensin-converting enzyme-like n=1 Tax=Uranotaenia lowii TaxID=190385 RepID=UPI002479D329|nr:angiotensin-converting enzyme-like [Uranotaenia lowii]